MEILNYCPPFQSKANIKRILINDGYELFRFSEILCDETSLTKKIKKLNYLSFGEFPIVDQGRELIGGYTDEKKGVYNKFPCIIFGDHTRNLKYVDYPCFIGADGVKLINIKEKYKNKINIKYLYYYLKYNDIPNDGYSRHFKYIKLLLYVIPSLETQQKIVQVLDQAQSLIDKRKQQIALLDKLAESIFYEMFGDPVKNEKGWAVKKLGDLTTKISSGATPIGGASSYKEEGISLIRSMNVYDGVFVYDGLAFIDDVQAKKLDNVKVSKGDVLINITGASVNRACIVPDSILPARVNQHVAILRTNKYLDSYYLLYLLVSRSYKNKLYNIATSSGATREALTKKNLLELELPVPPLSLQNQFAAKIEKIEMQKKLLEDSLKLMEDNYNCLMQKAFKGELFN